MIVVGRVSQKMAPVLQQIYANREAEITELEQARLRRLPPAVKVSGQRVAWETEEHDGPTA
jgi:hypothetical protein